MNGNSQIIDAVSLIMEDEDYCDGDETGKMSVDDAFVVCMNERVSVDIQYIAALSGADVQTVIDTLDGSIFQLPETFDGCMRYNLTKGWVISASYLCGNVKAKLKKAVEANRRFPGRFRKNIEALEKIVPSFIGIEDIHVSLGAPWIPAHEYMFFIKDFLRLHTAPDVAFYEELLRWKITQTEESYKSVLNKNTYGVQEDGEEDRQRQYLTALDIIEQTMNARTIKVYDYKEKFPFSSSAPVYEPVFNRNKTVEAQEKQKEICDAFKDWVCENDVRSSRFEGYYNDSFAGYVRPQYNGDCLRLPGLNPEVVLYKHQRDVLARILFSNGNILLAHGVGTGKTYIIAVAVRELYRLGISRKNMIVVPNNVLGAVAEAHRYLYPDDNILVVYPKDFTPDKRNNVLEKIRAGDYTAVYMAYSSFDMIVMSKKHYTEKKQQEIIALKEAQFNAVEAHEKKAIRSRIKQLNKQLEKYEKEEKECPWITFDRLGIETLVVDEAHNYKNIPVKTRADDIVGMGSSRAGSKKCREMLEKAHFVNRIIFATGTPITNSITDVHSFQMYLQPEIMEYYRLDSFDMWINTFGQREMTVECDVDANSGSLRTMTRFSSFHNLGELMSLFSQVCDFYNMEGVDEGLPEFNGYTDVIVPKNKTQHEYIRDLSKRTEKIRGKKVSRDSDNLLKVTIDGRKAALDMRLIDENYKVTVSDSNKIEACADKVTEIYRMPDTVQIVFSDIGIPKEGFNVYDELRSRLIDKGILADEIAFVHDAISENAKTKLFADMNEGRLRVVIGSTAKIGTGTNVQEKLVAIHHLSVPWRPADMVQREGRILRQGNTSKEVFIYRYITSGSFDAYSWQILENKQRFIAAFLSGTSPERDADDVADTVLTYAEVKALAIGNPLVKKRMEVSNRLERMKIAARGRQKQMQELKRITETLPPKAKKLEYQAQLAREDFEKYQQHKQVVSKEERISFGEELLAALETNLSKSAERVFDMYRGFDIILPAEMTDENRYITVRSEGGGSYNCHIEKDKKPMGCSKVIDYLLEHLNSRSEKLYSQAQTIRKQIAQAQEELEKDNPYINEIHLLRISLAEIDSEIENRRIEEAV